VIAAVKTIHAVSHPVPDMNTLSIEREDGWSIVPDEDIDVMTEL
jgi:hypothetical protein